MFTGLNKFFEIILICWQICISFGASVTDISRLRADLLSGYDPQNRPIINHTFYNWVGLNFMLYGFELDEYTSTLNVYALTRFWWYDDHMTWDPSRYTNITRIQFAAHELWKPDLTVYNNVDKSEFDHFGNTPMTVFNNSLVYWVVPSKFQVGCTTNLRKWPYDTQNCTIVLGSWDYNGYQIDIHLPENVSEMDTSHLQPNRNWNLLGTSMVKRSSFIYWLYWPSIVMDIVIARKSPVHSACIIAPGLVIAWAVLLAFWLPPDSPERLLILLMDIAINTLYLFYIYSMIPNNGDSIPLVLLFYRDSLVMLSFALVWTICMRYLGETQRHSPVPLPGSITSFLESAPAKILCLEPRPSTGGGDTSNEGGESTGNGNPFGNGVEKGNPFQIDWAWLAYLLDRVLFMIYLVIYTCFILALL